MAKAVHLSVYVIEEEACTAVAELLRSGWAQLLVKDFRTALDWLAKTCWSCEPGACTELAIAYPFSGKAPVLLIKKTPALRERLEMGEEEFKHLHTVAIEEAGGKAVVVMLYAHNSKALEEVAQQFQALCKAQKATAVGGAE
jgi:hypothetical protein